jgi:hypothetical protein
MKGQSVGDGAGLGRSNIICIEGDFANLILVNAILDRKEAAHGTRTEL